MQSGGTPINIETAAGEELLTFQPTKEHQSFLICSLDLQKAESYVMYICCSSSGTSIVIQHAAVPIQRWAHTGIADDVPPFKTLPLNFSCNRQFCSYLS